MYKLYILKFQFYFFFLITKVKLRKVFVRIYFMLSVEDNNLQFRYYAIFYRILGFEEYSKNKNINITKY